MIVDSGLADDFTDLPPAGAMVQGDGVGAGLEDTENGASAELLGYGALSFPQEPFADAVPGE